MKINKISALSFNGIKVNKKKPMVDIPRISQQEIHDSWKNNLKKYTAEMNTQGAVLNSDSYTINTNGNDEGGLIDTSDNYNLYVKYLIASFPKLKERMSEAQLLAELEKDNIRRLKEADEKTLQIVNQVNSYGKKSVKNGIDSIAGYEHELSILNKEFIQKVELEKEGKDIDIFGSILFFGPYGNGKTYITKAIAKATGCNIEKIRPANSSKEEAISAMEKIQNIAEANEKEFKTTRKRTIIFIDEADRILNEDSPIMKDFEAFIEKCSKEYHCSVFVATNNPLDLGVNYANEDIFPIKMSIDLPEGKNLIEMFKYNLSKYKTSEINYDELISYVQKKEAEKNGRYTNGQINNICKEANWKTNGEPITQTALYEAIDETEPDIDEELIEKFNNDFSELIQK